jgi:hypothetical protein
VEVDNGEGGKGGCHDGLGARYLGTLFACRNDSTEQSERLLYTSQVPAITTTYLSLPT